MLFAKLNGSYNEKLQGNPSVRFCRHMFNGQADKQMDLKTYQ